MSIAAIVPGLVAPDISPWQFVSDDLYFLTGDSPDPDADSLWYLHAAAPGTSSRAAHSERSRAASLWGGACRHKAQAHSWDSFPLRHVGGVTGPDGSSRPPGGPQAGRGDRLWAGSGVGGGRERVADGDLPVQAITAVQVPAAGIGSCAICQAA